MNITHSHTQSEKGRKAGRRERVMLNGFEDN